MNIAELCEQVSSGVSRRFDCPCCGGTNTLSITNDLGKIKYYCFKDDCNIGGAKRTSMTGDEIRSLLQMGFNRKGSAHTEVKQGFKLPDYCVMGLSSEKCFKLISKTNSSEAYEKGLFQIAFDPRQDRMLYLVQDEGKTVGAIGRSLSGQLPKVLNYEGSADIPFICGTGETLVLVEDCASACAVARDPSLRGVALLGTTVKDPYIYYLKNNIKYKNIVIALDKDANKSSIKIRNRIKYYLKDISIWKLPKDIKDMDSIEFEYFMSNVRGIT